MKVKKFKMNDRMPTSKRLVVDIIPTSSNVESAVEESENLRPQSLDDIIGQKDAIKLLKIKLNSFRKSNIPVGHIFFTGPSGTGKTTLAKAMAYDMGVTCHMILSQRIKTFSEITSILKNIKKNDIIFIDEIHGLNDDLQNLLYDILEENAYTNVKNGTERVVLPTFTMIAATTHKGSLNDAFTGRLHEEIILSPYTHAEMQQIVDSTAKRVFDLWMDEEVTSYIAQVVMLNPRRAHALVQTLTQYVHAMSEVPDEVEVTVDMVKECLKLQRRDIFLGLDALMRRYLVTLHRNKGVGLNILATQLGEESDTLTNKVEPVLFSRHYCRELNIDGSLITKDRVRRLTDEGVKLVEAFYDLRDKGYFVNEVW